MSTNYQKQLSTDQDDDQGRYVQEYTLMRCMLLIISITKCPHSKKSHQNTHTGNNVKYEVIWKWQLFVMLLIYKEHASRLHSVLDKSGLRVSIDTQLWMPFIFVPAFKSPNIILEKWQASGNRSIYLSGLFFSWNDHHHPWSKCLSMTNLFSPVSITKLAFTVCPQLTLLCSVLSPDNIWKGRQRTIVTSSISTSADRSDNQLTQERQSFP